MQHEVNPADLIAAQQGELAALAERAASWRAAALAKDRRIHELETELAELREQYEPADET